MRAFTLVLAILCALAASAASTRADDNTAEPDARALFEQGVALANTQAWQQAAARFRASIALEPRASTLFNLAVALYRLERYAELLAVATRYLELNDPARSDADRAEMTKLLTKALERVARVRIAVSPSQATVQLDDALLEPSALASDLVVDPGPHTITARADGYAEQHASVEALAGERASVHLSLTPAALPSERTAPGPVLARPSPALFDDYSDRVEDDDSSVWSSPWLWLGVGAGAAAVATVAIVLLAGGEEAPADYGRMTF